MAKTQKIQDVPKPDRTIRLAECRGILLVIARAAVKRHGFYTFVDDATNEKVMVLA